ncbi:MAG: ABC transporter permease [Eubacteriaceae bacterium]|nr:ABC transporter permease [Eubacteriaceae bacterium]
MSTHTHTHTDKKRFEFNRKTFVTMMVIFAVVYLVGVGIWGLFMDPESYAVNYDAKFVSPNFDHPFGTDFMGRDMFSRCIKALSNSLIIGVLASLFSSFIALFMGVASAVFGGWVDKFVNWCVDLCQGLPHLVLLILISFMLGKGVNGVTLAVIFTHWPSLTRIVRAEVMQVRSSQYVQAAYKMGKTKWQVAATHILPHVIPSYVIGLILLFPHAIMHEASVTFLGFGLPKEMPAIGVILSESMDYLATGKWWLAVFPGLMLLVAVVLFDVIGDNLKKLWNPQSGNE